MIHIEFKSSFKRSFIRKLEVYRPGLYQIAWSWCHDAALAEDLVQDTYAKALKNRSQLKDINKLKPWLTRILVNLHTDYYRVKKEHLTLENQHLLTEQDPSSLASRDESIQHVRHAISQLNDKHRKIVSLIDISEFSYAEVAEILDIPMGTVMSRLNRARETLKALLYELDKPCEELHVSSSKILRRVK